MNITNEALATCEKIYSLAAFIFDNLLLHHRRMIAINMNVKLMNYVHKLKLKSVRNLNAVSMDFI